MGISFTKKTMKEDGTGTRDLDRLVNTNGMCSVVYGG